jgi:hypothetical protein
MFIFALSALLLTGWNLVAVIPMQDWDKMNPEQRLEAVQKVLDKYVEKWHCAKFNVQTVSDGATLYFYAKCQEQFCKEDSDEKDYFRPMS